VKNAREMALLPYTKRVASARAPRPGADREDDEKYVDKYADRVSEGQVADGGNSDGEATEAPEAAGADTEVEA